MLRQFEHAKVGRMLVMAALQSANACDSNGRC